jgi:hypothetical protein
VALAPRLGPLLARRLPDAAARPAAGAPRRGDREQEGGHKRRGTGRKAARNDEGGHDASFEADGSARSEATRAWGLSWLVAFPTLLLVLPLVRRAVARIVAPL